MTVIYEPRGKAREYAELALNLYDGCRHGCRYCYCPAILRRTLTEWSAAPRPRADVLEHLRREAPRRAAAGDRREILLCFMSDPYQSDEAAEVTGAALAILAEHRLAATVLTKGGGRAQRHFDRLAAAGFRFGTTLLLTRQADADYWEPGAAPLAERAAALRRAKAAGVATWVSVEPVIDPAQALEVIRENLDAVDYWKVGKLNHRPDVERGIDWAAFLAAAVALLKAAGARYYIKRDLARYGEKTAVTG